MATLSFSEAIEAWNRKNVALMEALFKLAAQKMRDRCIDRLEQVVYAQPPAASGYKRTGFLRASLMASTASMPLIDRASHPVDGQSYTHSPAQTDAVIVASEMGDTIHFGFIAAYAAHVEFGARGVPPRSYVRWAIAQWPQVVNECVAEVRARSA